MASFTNQVEQRSYEPRTSITMRTFLSFSFSPNLRRGGAYKPLPHVLYASVTEPKSRNNFVVIFGTVWVICGISVHSDGGVNRAPFIGGNTYNINLINAEPITDQRLRQNFFICVSQARSVVILWLWSMKFTPFCAPAFRLFGSKSWRK